MTALVILQLSFPSNEDRRQEIARLQSSMLPGVPSLPKYNLMVKFEGSSKVSRKSL